MPSSGDAQARIEVRRLATEIAARIARLPHKTVPAMRAIRREYSKRISPAPPGQVVDLVLELRKTDVHRFVGDELIVFHKAASRALRKTDLERLGAGMNSWDEVDSFAPYLSGPAWREGQISDGTVHRWARSRDRWWRRAALVSTVALNIKARGGSGDASRTLAVCDLLIADRDDMVVKAMSWALRALSLQDKAAVREFVSRHESELAPRVLREVRHKLRTGLKRPRRGPAPA